MSPALENSLIILGSTAVLTGLLNFLIEKKKSSWQRSLEGLRIDLGKDVQLQIEEIKKEFSKEIQIHRVQFAKEFEILEYLWQHISHLCISINNALVATPENSDDRMKDLDKILAEVGETILIRSPFLPEKINALCRKLSAATAHLKIEMSRGTTDSRSNRLKEERLKITEMVNTIEEAIRERIYTPR